MRLYIQNHGFDYRAPELPVHLVLSSFLQFLPGNYKETQLSSSRIITGSHKRYKADTDGTIMFSWTNMVGMVP